MGISPPSDLVLDVMQAQDVGRARQVMSRLQSMAPSSDGAFKAELDTVAEATAARRTDPAAAHAAAGMIPAGIAFSGASLTGLRNAHALAQRTPAALPAATPGAAPLQKFEAMVLSQFIETMMPANRAVFGSGMAGDTWKSLLTQKVGENVARAGGIGIAARLAQSHGLFAAKAGGGA